MTDLSANQYICPEGYGTLRFLDEAAGLGFSRVAVNRAAVEDLGVAALGAALKERGLALTSLNSAGYFTWGDPARRIEQQAINSQMIEAAAALEAPVLTVITGGAAEQADLATARGLIAEGLLALDAEAAAAGVALGLEPIHPIGIPDKGCVNSIAQARAMTATLPATGLLLDFHHSWWDPDFAGAVGDPAARVRMVQICNLRLDVGKLPRRSPQLDHGGLDMAAELARLRSAGYAGAYEFEIFANDHGEQDIRPLLAAAAGWARGAPNASIISPTG